MNRSMKRELTTRDDRGEKKELLGAFRAKMAREQKKRKIYRSEHCPSCGKRWAGCSCHASNSEELALLDPYWQVALNHYRAVIFAVLAAFQRMTGEQPSITSEEIGTGPEPYQKLVTYHVHDAVLFHRRIITAGPLRCEVTVVKTDNWDPMYNEPGDLNTDPEMASLDYDIEYVENGKRVEYRELGATVRPGYTEEGLIMDIGAGPTRSPVTSQIHPGVNGAVEEFAIAFGLSDPSARALLENNERERV